jgi:hypothetical protein
MKKQIVIFSFLLINAMIALGQEPLSFSKVIKTDSVGRSMLYNNIKDWFVSSFNDAKAVIQIENKEDGIITGKAKERYSTNNLFCNCSDGYIDYLIKIMIKDNRYEVEVTNFTHSVGRGQSVSCELGLITTASIEQIKGNAGCNKKIWADLQDVCKSLANTIFISLEQKTKSLKIIDDNSNW